MIALVLACAALATQTPYVLAIGVNQPHASELTPLRFADDDAAEAALLFGAAATRTWLHTVLDEDSQARYPQLRRHARPATRQEILRSVAEMQRQLRLDRERGALSTVLIWLSGHAARDDDGHAYFPLHRGRLPADALVDDIVTPLTEAHRVHLVVDTCFAAALVRARAAVEEVSADRAEQAFWERGIGAHPNVGALIGASAGALGYEWEQIRSGVFSAMVRAGLRGAADVDGDERVGYRELAAFLAAAAEGVVVTEARPDVRVWPPAIVAQAPLSARSWFAGVAVLQEELADFGTIHVLDADGGWVLAGAFEAGHIARLWLPLNRPLYLRARGQDHALVLTQDGQSYQLGATSPVDVQQRSLVAESLRSGLFARPFGPAFFGGYRAGALAGPSDDELHNKASPVWPALLTTSSAALSLGTALVGGVLAGDAALRYAGTDLERPAHEAYEQMLLFGSVAAGGLVLGAGFLTATLWLWPD